MNHPSPDQLWLLSHDALEPEEARDVRAHLAAGCEECDATFADAERAAGTLALDADPREPSAAVRERLLARIEGWDAQAPLALPLRRRRARRVPWALAAGLVGVGIALGSGATWLAAVSPQADRIAAVESTANEALRERDLALAARDERAAAGDQALRREREAALETRALLDELAAENRAVSRTLARVEDRLADREGAAARLSAERDALDLALNAADAALRLLQSPGVEWLVLSAEDDASRGAARFFWEWERGDCLIDGGDLPSVAEGQSYALWVAYERGAPALVATFAPDATGSARLLARLPDGEGEVRSVRITVEDAPDPQAPVGETLLAGVLF